MLGLKAVLDASATLPDVRRDPVFTDIFDELSVGADTCGRVLAMRAGDAVDTVRRFGEGPDAFELVRNADIEWFVAGAEGPDLNQAFDEGVSAIFDAIDDDHELGGAVVRAEIVDQPELGTDVAGARAVLTAVLRVQLTYTSPRPY